MVASQEQCAGSAELLPYLCLCISAALLLALAALFHVLRSKPQVEIRAPAQEKQSAAASTQLVSPPILKRRGTIWAKYPSWNLDLPPTPPLNTEGIEHVVEILKKFDLSPDTGECDCLRGKVGGLKRNARNEHVCALLVCAWHQSAVCFFAAWCGFWAA